MRRSQIPVKGQVQVQLQMQVQGQVILTKMQEYAKFGKSIHRDVKHGQVCERMVKHEKLFEKKYIIYKCIKEKQKCV